MTRTEGLQSNTSPTGVKYHIVPTDYNPSMFMVKLEGKGGPVTADLAGTYTGVSQAQKAITRHLLSFWERFESKGK